MRKDHTITAITISSSLVVVVFGGKSSSGDVMADTIVLEYSEYAGIVIKLRLNYPLKFVIKKPHTCRQKY